MPNPQDEQGNPMTQRIAIISLATAALLMPLAWSPFFSDFDGTKWLILLVTASCCLPVFLQSMQRFDGAKQIVFSVHFFFLFAILLIPNATPFLLIWVAVVSIPDKVRARRVLSSVVALSTFLTLLIGLLQERELLGDWLPYRSGSFAVTLGNAGHVAEFGVAALPLIWAFCRRHRWYWTLAYSLPAVALVLRSDSRAGLIAMGLSTALWLVLCRRRKTSNKQTPPLPLKVCAIACVALSAIAVFGAPDESTPAPFDRLSTVIKVDHPTNQVRLELWEGAWKLFTEAPWLGQGPFEDAYPAIRGAKEWALSGFSSVATHPHNEFLHLLATTGLAGLLGLVIFVWLLTTGCRGTLRGGNDEDRFQLNCALAQWLGIGVMALFWAPFGQPTIVLMLLLSLGLVFRIESLGEFKPIARISMIRLLQFVFLVLLVSKTLSAPSFLPNVLGRDAQFVSQRDGLEAAKRHWASEPTPELLATLTKESKDTLTLLADRNMRPTHAYRLLLALTDIRQTMLTLASSNNRSTEEARAFRGVVNQIDLRAALASKRYKQHTNLNLLHAQFESSEGRNSEATNILERLIRNNPAAPQARVRLAAMAGEAGLPDRAIRLLEEEIAIYGHSPRADATWEILARTTGWSRRLEEASKVVERWIDALGPSTHRQSVGGAMTLHIGETPSSVGAFLRYSEPFADRTERGNLFAASLAGLPPKERHARCLAHLFEHPHDAAVLDALGDAISMRLTGLSGEAAQLLRTERYRALARAKTLHAWEDHDNGEDSRALIFLRLATKANKKNFDTYLVKLIVHLEKGDNKGALEALKGWGNAGGRNFDALKSHPLTRQFRETPAAQAVIDDRTK